MDSFTDDSYKIDKDVEPDATLDCSALKNGDFYYAFPNPVTKENDTTFVTIKDKMYLERMNKGKTYSLLDIQWLDDCQFKLIFKDSNDPYKKKLSKEGEIYNYQVMSSTPNSFTIKFYMEDQAYKFELFKMK